MMKSPLHLASTVLLGGLIAAGPASAATVILHPILDADVNVRSAGHGNAANAAFGITPVNATTSVFRFAFLQFDTSGLTPGLPKTLTLSVSSYSASPTTGSSVGHLVAMGADVPDTDGADDGDFSDITGSSSVAVPLRQAWFETNVSGQDLIGDYQFIDRNTVSVDVTDVVDEWIAGTRPNYGFALYTTDPAVNIWSAEHTVPALRPTLTQVPEPAAVTLGLLAGLAGLSRRRLPSDQSAN